MKIKFMNVQLESINAFNNKSMYELDKQKYTRNLKRRGEKNLLQKRKL